MDDECVEELGRPISSLKVTELKDELTKRALSKSGKKQELIDRLRSAIQRQSSHQSIGVDLLVSQQQGQQQQQQSLQTASQFTNAAVVMQQNQLAPSYQLDHNRPQIPSSTYALPINQQQYQQNLMQPIDLQQQLTDCVPQIQLTQNYQNPHHQTQTQSITDHIQHQASVEISQPPIDMRVPQQSNLNQDDDQGIDLSSSGKQASQQDVSESPSSGHEQDTDSKELERSGEIEHSMIETGDVDVANTGEKVPQTEESRDESHEVLEAPASNTSETRKSEQEEVDKDEQSLNEAQQEQVADEGSKISPSERAFPDPDVSAQTSISLKRGNADQRSQSSKEKRRKWSSKGSDDSAIDSKNSEVAQPTIISTGISSQRLQELIEEKISEKASSKVEVVQKNTTIEPQHDKESAQVSDEASAKKRPESPEKMTEPVDKPLEKQNSELNREQSNEAKEPTNVLLIQNLVRPFTLPQLRQVLSKHGSIVEDRFWVDKVKSKCCVKYEDIEVAKKTKESLDGQQWPSSNPKTLKINFVTDEILDKLRDSEKAKQELNLGSDGNSDDPVNKSIIDRLGEKADDVEAAASGDSIKSRLGGRLSDASGDKQPDVSRDYAKPPELDDLFKKTKSIPHLFWLPLTDTQADVRQKQKLEREARRKELSKDVRQSPQRRRYLPRNRSPPPRRSPPRYRSPPARRLISPGYRSPIARRPPPVRSRSPALRRSPQRNRSPRRSRSPVRRRSPGPSRPSPPRRRSPAFGRSSPSPRHSPAPMHTSPGPKRRSPGPVRRLPGTVNRSSGPLSHNSGIPRRSPAPTHRRPGPQRRSPGLMRRSPGFDRRSPGFDRRSPGFDRRSPGFDRRSPGFDRRSPGFDRRSPGFDRRSPGFDRRSPGFNRRSPRRSPPPVRGSSPGRLPPRRRENRI